MDAIKNIIGALCVTIIGIVILLVVIATFNMIVGFNVLFFLCITPESIFNSIKAICIIIVVLIISIMFYSSYQFVKDYHDEVR